jgi:hypothetical protein
MQNGKRTELLVNVCTLLNAKTYLSPLGAAGYLIGDMQGFAQKGITVTFQHYEHPVYRQQFQPFCPYGSVIDLLFNEGQRSLEVLRSGSKAPFLSGEVVVQVSEKVEVR